MISRIIKFLTGNIKTVAVLLLLLVSGFYIRCGTGLHWDSGQHLHPDERFLTMVTNDIALPDGITSYLDSRNSPLNPYNRKYNFFVYGTFPIFLTKVIAVLTDQNTYWFIPNVGRILSSVFDMGTVFLIFLIGLRLYSAGTGLLAAALLTFTVMNIQHSHFYGVEMPTAFFVALTFYLAVLLLKKREFAFRELTLTKKTGIFIMIGAAFGLALSSKISAVYFLPFLVLTCILPHFGVLTAGAVINGLRTREVRSRIFTSLLFLAVSGIVTAFTFRFFQPYAFGGSSIFNFSFSETFLSNMRDIQRTMKGSDMPPSIQWVGRTPVVFSLYNMIFWQMGFFLGVSCWFGAGLMLFEIFFRRRYIHILPLGWVLFWFLYQSTQFVKASRYLSTIYPFFAIIAAYFLLWSAEKVRVFARSRNLNERVSGRLAALPVALVLGFTVLWAVAFTRIYRYPHSRVAASDWIYDNISCGAYIANEHWDDSLPLRTGGRDGFAECYKWLEFNHYWIDDEKKLKDTLSKIEQADYIVLSSNRLYLSIPRLPRRFPFTIEYYRMLFSGELGFDLVKTFTSYPGIFGLEFNSDGAEEPFTVYDHPKVFIFKKNPERYDYGLIERRLSAFPPGESRPLTEPQ